MRILVVDDSRTMRRILADTLRRLGDVEISEVSDAREALTIVEEFAPDVSVIDFLLPSMDGVQLVRSLRRRGILSPVLMVTTEADRRRVIEAARAGVNDYLIKPFTPDALLDRVRRLAGGCAAVTEAA